MDDEGGGAAYPQTYADVQVTRAVLGFLAPLLNARQPGLAATLDSQLDRLAGALLSVRAGGQWQSPGTVPLPAREQVGSAIGGLLESAAAVPDLLELPPAH